MPLTSAQLTALATELTNDPDALGYAPYIVTTDVDSLISILTFIRDGVTPCPVNGVVGNNTPITKFANNNLIPNNSVTTQQILGAIKPSDISTTTLSAQEQIIISGLMNDGAIALVNPDGTENNNVTHIKKLIANPSTSLTNVIALENRNGSRIEQILNVANVVPTEADLHAALGK